MARPLTAAAERALAEAAGAACRGREAGGGTPERSQRSERARADPLRRLGAQRDRERFLVSSERAACRKVPRPSFSCTARGTAAGAIRARRGIAAGTRPYRVHADAHRPRGARASVQRRDQFDDPRRGRARRVPVRAAARRRARRTLLWRHGDHRVADRIPERIKALAYLDAFIPEDGESLFDINIPANTQRFLENAGFYRRPERSLLRRPISA